MNIDRDQERRAGWVIYSIFAIAIGAVLLLCFACGAVLNSWVI